MDQIFRFAFNVAAQLRQNAGWTNIYSRPARRFIGRALHATLRRVNVFEVTLSLLVAGELSFPLHQLTNQPTNQPSIQPVSQEAQVSPTVKNYLCLPIFFIMSWSQHNANTFRSVSVWLCARDTMATNNHEKCQEYTSKHTDSSFCRQTGQHSATWWKPSGLFKPRQPGRRFGRQANSNTSYCVCVLSK